MKTKLIIIIIITIINMTFISLIKANNCVNNTLLAFSYENIETFIDFQMDEQIIVVLHNEKIKQFIETKLSDKATVIITAERNCLIISINYKMIYKNHQLCLKRNDRGVIRE